MAKFFADHALSTEAVPVVEKKLRAAARKADVRGLLLALPVILDDGRFRVFALHEADADVVAAAAAASAAAAAAAAAAAVDQPKKSSSPSSSSSPPPSSSSSSPPPPSSPPSFAGTAAAGVNVTQAVRKAFAAWNVSLDVANYELREAAFASLAEEALRVRVVVPCRSAVPWCQDDGSAHTHTKLF